ncbi:AAA family ATPase [Aeromonas sp. S16(2024)]|uniref:AAA family ATPase n=1 Tax=Aeromonas sp. S16(2024) TaxID=3242889 RepID=UPI0035299E2E
MSTISSTSPQLHVRFGDFELDERNARLLHHGHAVPLSPIPFNLLCTLIREHSLLLTKDELLDRVWGHRFVSASVLKGAISDIRTLLADDPRAPRFIETVSRRGYRFICPLLPQETGYPLAAPATTPLPISRQRPSLGLFVGRGEALARLQDAWQRAAQGLRAIVWIAGEPGIGKSTLIAHFCAGIPEALWVRGQCVQLHGAGEPYLPVLEAIAELCRRDEEAVSLLRSVAPTWLLQLPWLCSPAQRETLLHELVGAHPQRMLREMSEFLDRYTEQRPLLLITEDLHWGDPSTLQLIDYLARRRSPSRLMWLGSVRPDEPLVTEHPLHGLRQALRGQGLGEEIGLAPFSEQEVVTYVSERMPAMNVPPGLALALHERTGGVPLFVAALATEVMSRTDHDDDTEPARLVRRVLPESLGALIDHHVARLLEPQRQLLAAAAVLGMRVHVDTLARVLACSLMEMAQQCEALIRERLWLMAPTPEASAEDPSRCVQFRHQLFRQRLYDGLSAPLRGALHGKIGSTLEALRAEGQEVTAAELAMHFDRGHAPIKALGYYAEAARAALLHLCPAECMSLTARALALIEPLPESASRHALEITLATLRGAAAFHTLGAGEEARRAYQRAADRLAEVPAHPMAGLALHGLGFLHALRAEYPEALAVAARARGLAAAQADPLLILAACTVQGQALMMQGHHDAARETLEQALPLLEQAQAGAEHSLIGFIADPQTTVLALLSLSLAQLGLFTQARARLQQAYARAHSLAQPMALLIILWCDALCGIRRGEVARVAALAGEMRALVDEFALAQGQAPCRWFQGWADTQWGRPHEGAHQIRQAYLDNRALGMISGGSETLGYLAEALLLQHEWHQAQEQLDQALALVRRHGVRGGPGPGCPLAGLAGADHSVRIPDPDPGRVGRPHRPDGPARRGGGYPPPRPGKPPSRQRAVSPLNLAGLDQIATSP